MRALTEIKPTSPLGWHTCYWNLGISYSFATVYGNPSGKKKNTIIDSTNANISWCQPIAYAHPKLNENMLTPNIFHSF